MASRFCLQIAIFLLTLTLAPCVASSVSLDLGTYGDNLQQRFSVPAGSSPVSAFTGFARIRPIWRITQSAFFEPSVALLLPWRSGTDGATKTFTSYLTLDLAYTLLSWMKFRVGPGIQWNFVLTQAATIDLNNGVGVTSFYIPGGSRNIFLLTAQAGLELLLFKSVSLGVDTWITEAANASRRRFHGAVYLGFLL